MPTAKKSASRPAAKKTGSRQDAIALLTADHREVKALFEKYKDLADSDAGGSDRQAIAETVCDLLTVHATIEEEIFYPAAREALDAEDLLDEAEVEHASAKDLIAKIKAMAPDDDLYNAKVTVLGEYVQHHVEEEEGEMFPEAKGSDMNLQELGSQLLARKNELLADIEELAATAKPVPPKKRVMRKAPAP